MGGMRLDRTWLMVHTGKWGLPVGRNRFARSVGLLAVLLLAGLAVVPAGASAEPLCTDTWTGGSSGTWQTASNWSSGHAPTSADVACIGAGTTVTVSESGQAASVLADKGTLVISEGSLELSGTLEASTTTALTISGGTLTGAATLDISGTFISDFESTMSGTGSTVLLPGASGEFESGIGTRRLSERSFVNEGTLKLFAGSLTVSNGALVKNTGTLDVDRETPISAGSGATPHVVNEGTFQKVEGESEASASKIQVSFENKGTVNAKKGTLRFFVGGSSSGSTNKWTASEGAKIEFAEGSFSLSSGAIEDAIEVNGATVTATSVKSENAKVTLASGSLSVPSGSTTMDNLTMAGGTLTGAGTAKVSGLFTWEFESTMSGTGSTVLLPGSTGNFEQVFAARIVERQLVNEGTATLTTGKINLSEGAELKNTGTFTVNSEYGVSAATSGTASHLVNTGTLQKTETSPTNTQLSVPLENHGTVKAVKGNFKLSEGGSSNSEGKWQAAEGTAIELSEGTYALASSGISGTLKIAGSSVSTKSTASEKAHLEVSAGTLTVESGTTVVEDFVISGGELTGSGTLDISGSFISDYESTMSGAGSTVLLHGSSGEFELGIGTRRWSGRSFVNEGTLTLTSGSLVESNGTVFRNTGTVKDNLGSGEEISPGSGGATPLLVNAGTFERTTSGKTEVGVDFENQGTIHGNIKILHPVIVAPTTQYGGPENPSAAPGQQHSSCGKPVSCATGNESESQTDFALGGRGVGLDLTRYYNSQAAAEGTKGIFGYGWTNSFSDHLAINKTTKVATLYQADGSTVPFTEESGGSFGAPTWSQDILSGTESSGYTLTLAEQTKYKFAGSNGRLESVTDRDGNATTVGYNAEGHLETITDPASRKIKLKYNAEGLVESAEDPMGHFVKYTYESGNLKSVSQPAELSLRWQFKYNGSHEMTEMVDGRGGKTIDGYNASNQVTSQEDPAERTLTFEYEPFQTKITNKNTGSVTLERFTSNDEPYSITRGYETSSATTEIFTYNAAGQVLTAEDGNGHITTYGYDSAADRTSMIDPDKDETKWTYDSTHDIETMTAPDGETTTIKRESHGNPEVIERPAPGSKTQATKYKYTSHGELESVTNPLEHTWKYEYDSKGDRTAEIDPESNKRTWEYNEDSQETATVSPRGNVAGGKPTEFTTKIERDAQGRPLTITDPLKHTTKYKYDGDGNIEKVTDGNGRTTISTYNGDNQPIKVEAPNKAVTETEYDGAGQITAQIDGNKHKTKYMRNIIEEVTEVTNPLGHVITKEYNSAGNLVKLTDPAKRTTTYTYDPANRLTEINYSSGKPATIKYEYNKNGDRTKMTDGTGTTTYTYDQVDRLTESENGHKEIIKYEYNLTNDQTKITYPNEKSVTQSFDKDERVEKITDWLSHSTTFTYDPDSDLKATVFPSETKDEDKYTYNDADQMTEVKMVKSTETLASLIYTRDSDGQVKKITSKGLPGAETTENTYDENSRITKYGSTEYKYDLANNATKEGSSTNTYNEGDELEKGTGVTYSYDELGERTKATPEKGPATTYGYDQAGSLTSVERPKEGETAKIEDGYAYNGEGLRTSQTISGTTSYTAWDMSEELPLILSDGTNSYIYGPGNLSVEQINSSETPTYLHHDQQGSTRLLTGSAGTVTGKCTYGAYGIATCEGTTTTPLSYDGQYTSKDTGLIYLRARTYDPTTAQFLSVDPLVETTETPYGYAAENPLTFSDPTGFFSLPLVGSISGEADAACGATWEVPGLDAATCGVAAAATAYVAVKALSETVKLASENSDSTSPEVAESEPEAPKEESCKVPSRSLPYKGEPNSTQALDRGNGTGQIRDYGPDGLPEKDFDFGHDHGFGDPHAHDWLDGERGLGRPIGPNE